MLIIDAINIKKFFGDREILSFDELKIRSGDKIGILGQNGAGKTTLMNILSGEQQPDEGIVKRYCEIAYIRQFSNEQITAEAKILSEFEVKGKTNIYKLSGGEQTRLKIAGALSENSHLLLADEPTANLDLKGIEILKSKLKKVESLVLISHDRDLLDGICNKIIEVSDGKLILFDGSFSSFQIHKQEIFGRECSEYDNYVTEMKHLEEAIVNRKTKAKAIKKAPSRMGNSEARLHRRSSNEKQEKINDAAKALKTRLDKLEVKTKPRELPVIKLDFSLTNPPQNKIVIYSNNFCFGYEKKEIFHNAGFQIYNGLKHAIVGENGVGKTTLLNQIYACYESSILKKADTKITIVPKVKLGYLCQSFENLDSHLTVLENVLLGSVQNETTVRTILARLLINADNVYKQVGVLSGGERIKVSFAKMFVSDANVLLLDEPTNYLDMVSIEALQNILGEYEGTVLFVSHDKAFVNAVAQRLMVVEGNKILELEGNLEALERRSNVSKTQNNNFMHKMLLEMRMTELITKISLTENSDKEILEKEYQELVSQMRLLNDGAKS